MSRKLYTQWTIKNVLKSVKIWLSCSQMYTVTFYEPRRKCTFWFFQVRCAHKSGDVINFIIVACRIYSRLKWYKNYRNRLRLAKVIVKNKMSRFYGSVCTSFITFCLFIHSYRISLDQVMWSVSCSYSPRSPRPVNGQSHTGLTLTLCLWCKSTAMLDSRFTFPAARH